MPAPLLSALKNPDTARRIQETLDNIGAGKKLYGRDGITFHNRERHLPDQPPKYYSEYTVKPAAGVTNRGAERLVLGDGGEVYFSPDHTGISLGFDD